MNIYDFNDETVEELLKKSKQLQNKIRKELSLQAFESPAVSESKTQEPFKHETSVENTIASCLQLKNKASLPRKSNCTHEKQLRGVKTKTSSLVPQSNKRKEEMDSFSSFQRSTVSVEKLSQKLSSTVPSNAKRKTNQSLNESSKFNLESNNFLTTSSCRLPLQRFAESANKNVDFLKEHPHLELDMTSKQTTLFPRRFHRPTECVSQNLEECLNVVEAEVKPPKTESEAVVSETWNGILKKNKPTNKRTHKIVRLKGTKENILDSAMKCLSIAPEPQIKKQEENYDIIALNSSNGLFKLQKKSQELAKQTKCRIERFPVLCIRPDCKVQKVTNISICGNTESVLRSTEEENPTSNVRYIEFRHEDGDKASEPEIIPEEKGLLDMQDKDTRKEVNPTNGNKFFKALEFNYLNEYSTTNNESSSLNQESFSFNRSFSSLSSSSSSLKNVNPTSKVNEIQHRLRSSIASPPNRFEVPKSQCEVYVQTEKECQQSILQITSPLQNPTKSSPQSELSKSGNSIEDSLNKTAHLHKWKQPAEEDIIAKIFQRILNDLPNALEEYNNRNTHTAIGSTSIPKPVSSKNEHNQGENNEDYQNQTPASNNGLNAELSSNENEKMVVINASEKSSMSVVGAHRKIFLQRSPLFVQSIKENKPSAVEDVTTDVKGMNRAKQKCPKEVEIKRAVKIFLDSLTLDSNVKNSSMLKESSTKNRSMTFPKLKFIRSDSSNSSNSLTGINEMVRRKVKRNKNPTVCWSDISGSSSSIGLSSTDLDSESDATNNMPSISSQTNNLSEGEIKSIGEI